eukprot:403339665
MNLPYNYFAQFRDTVNINSKEVQSDANQINKQENNNRDNGRFNQFQNSDLIFDDEDPNIQRFIDDDNSSDSSIDKLSPFIGKLKFDFRKDGSPNQSQQSQYPQSKMSRKIQIQKSTNLLLVIARKKWQFYKYTDQYTVKLNSFYEKISKVVKLRTTKENGNLKIRIRNEKAEQLQCNKSLKFQSTKRLDKLRQTLSNIHLIHEEKPVRRDNVQTYNEWKECTREIYKYVIQRTEEEIKVLEQFYKRKPSFLKESREPILSDILEEEFRFQIKKLREKKLSEADKEEINHMDYIKSLMQLIMQYNLKLKKDMDIPFQSILINILNEDYRAFYDYKKKHAYLDMEKSVMRKKNEGKNGEDNDDYFSINSQTDNLVQSSARLDNKNGANWAQSRRRNSFSQQNTEREKMNAQLRKYNIFSDIMYEIEEQQNTNLTLNLNFNRNSSQKKSARKKGYDKLIGMFGNQIESHRSQNGKFLKYLARIKKLKKYQDVKVERQKRQEEERKNHKAKSQYQSPIKIQESKQSQSPKKVITVENKDKDVKNHFFNKRASLDVLMSRQKTNKSFVLNPVSTMNKVNLGSTLDKEITIQQLERSKSNQIIISSQLRQKSYIFSAKKFKLNLEHHKAIKHFLNKFLSRPQLTNPEQNSFQSLPSLQSCKITQKNTRKKTSQHVECDQIESKLQDIKTNIANFQTQFKEDPQVNYNNQYALKMFEEDIRYDNLKNSIQIYDMIQHAKKPKQQKLLYFYHVNSRDEINNETKLIKNEVRQERKS